MSSHFNGVSWDKSNSKWRAQIRIDGRATYLGYFDDEEAAARANDKAAARLGRPLNFPTSDGDASAVKGGQGGSSRFKGISWNKGHNKWEAKIMIDSKRAHLGSFDDEEAAARTYDTAAARVGRPLNFPATDGGTAAVKDGLSGSSHFTGVSWDKSNSKWRAQIKIDAKVTHLGYFNAEEAAAHAYDKAAARFGGH